MKKIVLLSALALSATVVATAQSPHMRHKLPVVCDQPAHNAAKTTANAARCIAIANSQSMGPTYKLNDSESYTYSGARGGSVMRLMKYDSGFVLQNIGGAMDPYMKQVRTFDSHDNILLDAIQQYNPLTSSYEDFYQIAYTYDAMNNKLTQTEKLWNTASAAWINQNKYTFTYNSSNNMITQTSFNWFSGAWTNNTFDTFTYNSSNKLTMDIQSGWSSSTATWVVHLRDSFTYDGADNLATDVQQSWTGTSWNNEYATVYGNYAVPGLYQSVVSQSWYGSAYVNQFKDSITYNTYSQPVFDFQTEWSSSTNSWVQDTFYTTHYYYELYTSGVGQVNSTSATLDVYPNPASGIINLRVDVAGGKNTIITLQDITGRVVHTIDGSDLKEGLNTIQCATDQLSAGTYFVHMANDKASVTRKVVVAK